MPSLSYNEVAMLDAIAHDPCQPSRGQTPVSFGDTDALPPNPELWAETVGLSLEIAWEVITQLVDCSYIQFRATDDRRFAIFLTVEGYHAWKAWRHLLLA